MAKEVEAADKMEPGTRKLDEKEKKDESDGAMQGDPMQDEGDETRWEDAPQRERERETEVNNDAGEA